MKTLEEYLYGTNTKALPRWCHHLDTVSRIAEFIPGVSTGNSVSTNVKALEGKRFIGMEFELEGIKGITVNTIELKAKQIEVNNNFLKFWLQTNDGSLRNGGKEFISYKGVNVDNVHEALGALADTFKWIYDGSKVSISSRCSVHVHYNLWDITLPELRSLVLAYMFVERGLYMISGNRYNNIFCVPCGKMNKANWENLFNPDPHFNEGHIWQLLHSAYHKYAGLNLKPMFNYGTIEFRHHEGTLDTSRIHEWILIIDELITNSRKIGLETLRNMGQDYWNTNELGKLVYKLSPRLFEKLSGYNINSLLEPDVKYGLWASSNPHLIPELDDSPNGKQITRRKKPIEAWEVDLPTVQPTLVEGIPPSVTYTVASSNNFSLNNLNITDALAWPTTNNT